MKNGRTIEYPLVAALPRVASSTWIAVEVLVAGGESDWVFAEPAAQGGVVVAHAVMEQRLLRAEFATGEAAAIARWDEAANQKNQRAGKVMVIAARHGSLLSSLGCRRRLDVRWTSFLVPDATRLFLAETKPENEMTATFSTLFLAAR
jgi:hypothetical protein